MNPQKGKLFFNELSKIEDRLDTQSHQSFIQLFYIVVEEVSSLERIPFNTLFSRIAYIGSKYRIKGKALYGLHALRKKIESHVSFETGDWDMAFWVMSQLLHKIYEVHIPDRLKLYEGTEIDFQRKKYSDYINNVRVTLLDIDEALKTVKMVSHAEPGVERNMIYDEVDINENFTINIKSLIRYELIPIDAHLHHIRIDDMGQWHPEIIVLEPDHLLDVTSVAGCFQPFGLFLEDYLLNRFLPKPSSKPILIGIIANYFLDQLIHNAEFTFQELFPHSFALNPLSISLLTDDDVRDIMRQSQIHFNHLKKAVKETFPKEGIDVHNILLEPSFYSPSYGLQGRLDVLHERADATKIDIVELKSGKPFRPNIYGLSGSHYVQTLLYDVIIKSIKKKQISPTCYIIYSKLDDRAMRHAPFVESKIKESMIARNTLIVYEKIFAHGDVGKLLDGIKINRFPHVRGFSTDKIVEFEYVYSRLNDLEKKYLHVYVGFIAREQKLSKLGSDLKEVNGLSGLWRDNLEQKLDEFNVINHLKFVQMNISDGVLELRKSEKTNSLSNFRKGDICILYADEDGQEDVLESHVMKGTILEENVDHIYVRLRSMSMNTESFTRHEYWHIEHDLIDSAFHQLYRSLFRFLRSDPRKKRLILGLEKPASPKSNEIDVAFKGMSDEQANVLKRIINSRDYFLLWGPPGTGKTSIMLRYYVDYLMNHTTEQILILSYTNRAVDEICKSISCIDGVDFVRIGSRYSCDPAFADRLLTNIMNTVSRRQEIKTLFERTRIIVGTLSSINGKPELWKLKTFNRVIVDEASQILEPQMVGLLGQFDHFTLIGDHKQLPAVSLQDKREGVTDEVLLNEMGITGLNVSLFERLYNRCQDKDWEHAYAMLSAQGRMHEEIMQFPSEQFYESTLSTLDYIPAIADRLHKSWDWSSYKNDVKNVAILTKRNLFYNSNLDLNAQNIKTNMHEANLVRDILIDLDASILKEKDYSIGVITPYRAQIATIRLVLEKSEIDQNNITIDTVERYQGGAKDIIIISLCINHRRQLDMLTAAAEEGIDRKLNVALTRAKEQIIVIGNKDFLVYAEYYKRFMEVYGVGL